jgi:hypothetical protein
MTISILNRTHSTSNQCCGSVSGSVGYVPIFWGIQDPDSLLFFTDPDPSINKQNKGRKTFISTVLWLLFYFLPMKSVVDVPSKSISKKTFFFGILSATDEKSRTRILPNPWIQIRIRTNMSRIHNTAFNVFVSWRSCYRKDKLKLYNAVLFFKIMGHKMNIF